jgi:hypothetical protein
LRAQHLALARGVESERGHHGEPLDHLSLGGRERGLLAKPVYVERPDRATLHEQRHADKRLRLLVGADDHLALRVEVDPRDVASTFLANGLAGDPRVVRKALGHDLLGPSAGRKGRTEGPSPFNELVNGQIVVWDKGPEMQRHPSQRVVQRVGREHGRRSLQQGLEHPCTRSGARTLFAHPMDHARTGRR